MNATEFRPPDHLIAKYADEGCTLLLLDAPLNLTVGIDLTMWKIGNSFKGINIIPLGIHYVYWSSSESRDLDLNRLGLFVQFSKPRQVVVLRWSVTVEAFVHVTEDELDRYSEGVENMHFMKFLGPYNLQKADLWKENTYKITSNDLKRVQPRSSHIHSSQRPAEYDCDTQLFRSSIEASLQQQDKQDGNICESFSADRVLDALFFCDFPNPRINSNNKLSGRELTISLMDTSQIIRNLMNSIGRDGIFAEMQIAFICFLLGQNFDAFMHWLSCLKHISNAESLVEEDPEWFCDAIRVVYSHTAQMPPDLAENPLFEGNVILREIINLIEITADSTSPKLEDRNKKLKKFVCQAFQLHGGIEDAFSSMGEFAPVILDESDFTFNP